MIAVEKEGNLISCSPRTIRSARYKSFSHQIGSDKGFSHQIGSAQGDFHGTPDKGLLDTATVVSGCRCLSYLNLFVSLDDQLQFRIK